jgi:hypothetical protein
MKKARKQHYVPIVYLKEFSNSTKKGHFLFVYDKENSNTFSSNIKNIGQETFFYDIDEENIIERFFGRFEREFGTIIKKITSNNNLECLNDHYKKFLSEFISIQFLRTKEKKIIKKELTEKLISLIGKSSFPSFKKGEITISDDSLRKLHDQQILETFIPISKILMDEMSWKLSINNTKIPFWTSDNPCAVYNELTPKSHKGNLGLKCKGFQLHFPLSSKLLLILINKNLKLRDLSKAERLDNKELKSWLSEIGEKINLDVVDIIPDNELVDIMRVTFENNLQVASSTRFIYSQEKSFSLANKWLKDSPYYRSEFRERLKRF